MEMSKIKININVGKRRKRGLKQEGNVFMYTVQEKGL